MLFKYLCYTINSIDDVKRIAESKEADGSPFDLDKLDRDHTLPMLVVNNGDLNILQYLATLKNHLGQPRVNFNQANQYGWTAFTMACRNKLDVVKFLAELKNDYGVPRVNLNKTTSNGSTPLHFTALNRELNVFKYLAELKGYNNEPCFNLNSSNDEGVTPLMLAVNSENMNVVKYLAELKDGEGNPRVNLNQADIYGSTALYYGRSSSFLNNISYLIDLRDNNGYLRVDINKAKLLQFYSANPEMAKKIRECGHFEKPSVQPEAVLQAADSHGQNVHAWYDIACGDKNLSTLQTCYTALDMKAPHDEGFAAFKNYVNTQITALKNSRSNNKNQNDSNYNSSNNQNDLAFTLIPAEFKANSQINENMLMTAAEKLTDRLRYFEELHTPSDWRTYAEEQPDGSDTKTINTAFKDYKNFKDIIGLMWNVLNNPAFVREILPPDADEKRVTSHITHLQQSFIHALLLADNCPKGRTSKLFHRVLEGVHPRFTTRSEIIEAFNTQRRKYQNTQISNKDVYALQPAITEDLLKQAYLAKDKYPQQFDDLVQYLFNPKFMILMDNNDTSYDQHFGVRQHIIGHAKRYLFEHFPKEYQRQKPIEDDYRVLEQQYIPTLFYKQLNQLLLAKPVAYNSVINDFFEAIHDAIQLHQPLPEITPTLRKELDSDMLPNTDDESWAVQYERQRKHLNQKIQNPGSSQEVGFQYTLLKIATKSSYEALDEFFDAVVTNELTQVFDAIAISAPRSYLPAQISLAHSMSFNNSNNLIRDNEEESYDHVPSTTAASKSH